MTVDLADQGSLGGSLLHAPGPGLGCPAWLFSSLQLHPLIDVPSAAPLGPIPGTVPRQTFPLYHRRPLTLVAFSLSLNLLPSKLSLVRC